MEKFLSIFKGIFKWTSFVWSNAETISIGINAITNLIDDIRVIKQGLQAKQYDSEAIEKYIKLLDFNDIKAVEEMIQLLKGKIK